MSIVLCRICMEAVGGTSMPLFNMKNNKTEICLTYEKITNLNVNRDDELPKECCFPCVAELNKSLAFRKKCLLTYRTLKEFYKMNDDDGREIEILHGVNHPIEEEIDASKNAQSHLIELPSITQEEDASERRDETSEEGVVLVYCINESAEEVDPLVKNTYKCSICAMEFVRKKNFENHYQKYHEQDTDVETKQIRLHLTKKEKSHEDLKEKLKENPNATTCKHCHALFLNEKSMKIHERRKNCQQKVFECKVAHCKKVFNDENLFQQHILNHETKSEIIVDETKKYKCPYESCTKSFNMLSTLKDHQRTHDQTKPYICSICYRGFSQNTNLKQHLRRHNSIKPFKCTWDTGTCTKSFVSKGELESHLRKHSGDHPFACESCNSKFTTSSSLLKHKRIHSGEKPYACEFCPMRFTALGTLKNHQKTHTGERPHACQYCDKKFAQKSDMTSHERTHTQSRPYACKTCNMSFHQNGTLKTHMKIHSKLSSDKNKSI